MDSPYLSVDGIRLLGLPVPAAALGLPSEDRRAYRPETGPQRGCRVPHQRDTIGEGAFYTPGPGCPRSGKCRTGVPGPTIAVSNHRFRRLAITEPRRRFTFVRPSNLPLARRALMVKVRLGHFPPALVCFVTWHLRGAGTSLDTNWSRNNELRPLVLVRLHVAMHCLHSLPHTGEPVRIG